MREFASELRAHREASGMSLEELFDRTRINPEYLRAIETGNYDILPDIYVRLFIKKYAQEVGLDVDETLNKYDKIRPFSGIQSVRCTPPARSFPAFRAHPGDSLRAGARRRYRVRFPEAGLDVPATRRDGNADVGERQPVDDIRSGYFNGA